MIKKKHFSSLYGVLIKPIVTEKSTNILESSQYVFDVSLDCNKSDIKKAVEAIFSVKVLSVNTLIRKGKEKTFRGRKGSRSDIKRAYVSLQKDCKIDLTAYGVS
jgi:large subunit ribosomal protein L23